MVGGVGSGKTLTALSYFKKMHPEKKLYVITTAKKRDGNDWVNEAKMLDINDIVVDSWNNIEKYVEVTDSFFIFDEQRAVGKGKWSQRFIKIAKQNKWVMLSATPGDTWMDYVPVFIANGFYRNRSHFNDEHVIFDPYVKFPKVKRYINTGRLLKLKKHISIPMVAERHTVRHRKYIDVQYPKEQVSDVRKRRWNIFEDKPIENAPEYMSVIRKLINSCDDRIDAAKFIIGVEGKLIVFYNYDYELYLLRMICEELDKPYSEWNGHKHEPLPDSSEWAYLVQYTAGAEGWNCTETNIMLFYSLNYSFKVTEQAEGRIDRINTPFKDLEYFYLVSNSALDKGIQRAISSKKEFNHIRWIKKEWDQC